MDSGPKFGVEILFHVAHQLDNSVILLNSPRRVVLVYKGFPIEGGEWCGIGQINHIMAQLVF
ncbi:MAG: hypothetical protein HC877_14565 [Thioploca sp.]|nr:hypothetical protein [Thioploca sp.]